MVLLSPFSRSRIAWSVGLSLSAHALLCLLLFPWKQPVERPRPDPGQPIHVTLLDAPVTLAPARPTPPRKPVVVGEPRLVEPPVSVGSEPAPTQSLIPQQPGSSELSETASPGSDVPGILSVSNQVRKVVYLLDGSMSMGLYRSYARAQEEVLASLRHLSPEVRFQVVLYNQEVHPVRLSSRQTWLVVNATTLASASRHLRNWKPNGATHPVQALRWGLLLRPDVLFLLADDLNLSVDEVRSITRYNRRVNQGRCQLHTVLLTHQLGKARVDSLRNLALENGGTCRVLILEP